MTIQNWSYNPYTLDTNMLTLIRIDTKIVYLYFSKHGYHGNEYKQNQMGPLLNKI